MPKYRLVGYSRSREFGRVRIYVGADEKLTAHSPVFMAPRTAPFDYRGEPTGLQPAPSRLATRVRLHLQNRAPPAYLADVPFEPLVGGGGVSGDAG